MKKIKRTILILTEILAHSKGETVSYYVSVGNDVFLNYMFSDNETTYHYCELKHKKNVKI